jgi:hypothetical protein
MSYLYRPTPVFNPGPSAASLSGAVSGGVMRGYSNQVDWKAYFDSKRAAPQGDPWIVKSGTMGSFMLKGMGDVDPLTGEVIYDSTPVSFDPGIFDPGTLPLTPYASDPTLNPISNYPGLPSSFFNMGAPSLPGGAPAIVSSGQSILTPPPAPAAAPGSPQLPGFSWAAVVAPLASLATSITKAVSGSGGSPSIAPTTVQANAQVAQAQALIAQANALQNTNPSLAAQYRAQANSLLGAGAGSGGSSFADWMGAPSSIIPSISNGGLLTIGGGVIFLLALTGTVAYHTGRK